MGLNLQYEPGQTPLSEEELEGLKIPTITDRWELDEFEQANIEQALLWANRRSIQAHTLLVDDFIRELHRRMFKEVWSWAGHFRLRDTNIGIPWTQIPGQLRILCDDARYWLEHQVFPEDEIAIRFKHRLVSIHCFSNGNGRHSRLIADLIAKRIFQKDVFSWGAKTGLVAAGLRKQYLKALQAADHGEIRPLVMFART